MQTEFWNIEYSTTAIVSAHYIGSEYSLMSILSVHYHINFDITEAAENNFELFF